MQQQLFPSIFRAYIFLCEKDIFKSQSKMILELLRSTDYRVPKTQQQSPEKIVRPCRENVRTQNTDNSSAGNARQIRPNETKENMREAAATLLNKNQKDNVRQSPLRTRETTANVRQKPFRPKDMENVRHITSVIIERTPERSTEEPVYSTGNFISLLKTHPICLKGHSDNS